MVRKAQVQKLAAGSSEKSMALNAIVLRDLTASVRFISGVPRIKTQNNVREACRTPL